MFDQKRAAEFLVVAWCKEWTLGEYLDAISEESVQHALSGGRLDGLREHFPWLTVNFHAYSRGTREYVAAAFPKLSEWLWRQKDDVSRLKAAPQIERLKSPKVLRGYVNAEDRKELKDSYAALRQSSSSYRMSRDSFKTHQRSAWNVCKA